MKIKRSLVVVALLSLVFVSPAVLLAQDSNTATDSSTSTSTENTTRKTTPEARQQQLQDLRTAAQKKREEAVVRFREQLQTIRDEKKQKIVEGVDARISDRNVLWVDHWNTVIDRLSGLLDKMSARASELASSGKDVSTVTSAISTAQSAVAAAQAAVDTQSTKVYVITISDEEKLGANVREVVNTFHSDVNAVITALNAARRSVVDAYSVLKSVASAEVVTSTPTATPTL